MSLDKIHGDVISPSGREALNKSLIDVMKPLQEIENLKWEVRRLEGIIEAMTSSKDMEEAKKKGIDLEHKYGINGQYINFIPKCIHPINKGDVITQGDINLYCVEPMVFIIYNRDKIDYVRGIHLIREFNKLEA